MPHIPIFNTEPAHKPPPKQPSPSDWESYTSSQRERKQAETWLELSETWDQWPGFAPAWEGVRHLGKGGAGSADLFRKIGCVEETEGMPGYVVVKQAERSDKDLLSESIFLQLFMEREDAACAEEYRGYHEGEGVPRNMGGMFEIGRENFRKRQKEGGEKDGIVLEEKVIWDMFECLARACMMLEHGYEASEAGMADFGLSAHVPQDPQDPGWLAHVDDQITVGWGAPEQFFPQMSNRSYSTPANVFGIAAIIYHVMMKQQIQIGQDIAYVGFPSNEPHVAITPLVLTCGRSLLDNSTINKSGIYSKTLVRTLLQCLAYSPEERMTARQLLDVCTKGRFVLANLLEDYTYKSSQPVTNYWPERGAVPMGIPGYEDSKDLLKYYPTHQSIAEAKEREQRFLASFWVTPTKRIAAPSLAFSNPFSSGTDLGSSSSTAFSFGQQSSTSQSSDSSPFKYGNNPAIGSHHE
ncbi:hypothetical protein DID88_007493 [Monilinia fructigena]|uniref:Protein kinase domain-containing protein n=1 Tax=Monilinia fructigena TaxID=38457 RepID=A0A395J7N7_9HELO|nr:hypothetical protein DID88_007493 [Monilinia fructigena]